MPNKPRTKRERNIHGDFVVTKINIKEREIVVPQNENEDEEDEESSEESEEEPEEVKKGKWKPMQTDMVKLIKHSPVQMHVFRLFHFTHSSVILLVRTRENFEQKRAKEARRRRVRAGHERDGHG